MLPRATNFTIPAPKKPEPLPCPYDLNPMLSPSLSSKYPQFMSQAYCVLTSATGEGRAPSC